MKTRTLTFLCVTLIAFVLVACGWKPSVPPTAITAPWSTMNLPVEKNAVVWGSTPVQFKSVHKEGRQEIGAAYILALTKAGYQQTKKDIGTNVDFYDFEKGSEKLTLQIYDFENTGVIIEKK